MGFNLGNWLEEKWADVNQWDGGKTGATVRAARKAPPAVTPSPTQTRRPAPTLQVRNASPSSMQGAITGVQFNPQQQVKAQTVQPAMPRFSVQQTLQGVQQPKPTTAKLNQTATRTPEQQRRLRELELQAEEDQRRLKMANAQQNFIERLNPFGEKGLFGIEQQKTYEKATEPVVNKLQQVMDKVNESDDQEGFQWSSPGDYGRFALNLLPGMAQGVIGAPTSVGEAVSGKRVNDQGQVEDLSGIQRGASLADATLSTAGLAVGGSGTLLKALGTSGKGLLANSGSKAAMNFIKDAGTESLEEVVQTLAQDLADNGKLEAGWKDYRDSAGLGFLGGGMMHGAGAAVQLGKNNIAKTIKEDYKPLYDKARSDAEAAKRENIEKAPEILEIKNRIADTAAEFRTEPNPETRKGLQVRAQGLYQLLDDTTRKIQRERTLEAIKSANELARRAVPGGTLGGELASGFKDAQAKGRVFEGVDGKPRFEVDDSGAKLLDAKAKPQPTKIPTEISNQKQALREEMIRIADTGDMAKVQEINSKIKQLDQQYPEGSTTKKTFAKDYLDHQKLYEQYPELRTVEVQVKSLRGKNGYATQDVAGQPVIVLDSTTLKNDPEYAKKTLLHELQHVIQNKEKFAGGSSDPNYDNYFRSAGEAEARAVASRMNMSDGERYKLPENAVYHSSPSGDLRGADYGLHVGTKQAAKEAIESRIGIRADGKDWDGSATYGNTKLAGSKTLSKLDPKGYNRTGFNAGQNFPENDFYIKDHPELTPKFSDGTPVSLDHKPTLDAYLIKGEMSNTRNNPMSDIRANSTMTGQKKKGTAKRGYYYTNDGEDAGSISAVLPDGSFLEKTKPQSTFYDTLDVPKKDLIVRQGEGKAMSVDPNKSVAHAGKTGTITNKAGLTANVKIADNGDLVLTKDLVHNGKLIAKAGESTLNGVPMTVGNQADYFIKKGELKLDQPTQVGPKTPQPKSAPVEKTALPGNTDSKYKYETADGKASFDKLNEKNSFQDINGERHPLQSDVKVAIKDYNGTGMTKVVTVKDVGSQEYFNKRLVQLGERGQIISAKVDTTPALNAKPKPTPQDALAGKSTKIRKAKQSSDRARSASQSTEPQQGSKPSRQESTAAANQNSTQSKSRKRKESQEAKKPLSSYANDTTKKADKQAYMEAFGVDEKTAAKDMKTVEKGTANANKFELTDEQLQRLEEVKKDEAITKAANKASKTGKRFDFIGVTDKNGRSIGIEVYNPKYHSIKKGKVVDNDGVVVGNHIKVDETGTSVAVGEGYENMDQLFGDIRKWKSQNKYTSTLERNIMEAAPDESTGRRVVNWLVGNKVKAERTWKGAIQAAVKKNDARYESVVKSRPKGYTKKEVLSDAMDYGEAKMTAAELTTKYGKEYAGKVTDAIDGMRADYDKYIADINTTRERFGLEPIKKRKDYITHISELNGDKNFVGDVTTALKNSITGEAMERTRGGVPADISGRTENFTPTAKWNQFLQQRKGGKFQKDPFKAFNEYVPNAEHNIHMTESIVRARAAEEFLRARTNLASMEADSYGTLLSEEVSKQLKGGPQNDQLVSLFQEYANALAGKTQKLDRAMLDSPLRPALKGWQWLQRVGGRATILGNASSVMMQPLNQVNVIAQVKPKAYAKGIANFLTNDKSIEKSNFVQARITHIDSKLRGKGQKFMDAAGVPLRAVEEQSVKLAWHANYQNVLDQGYKGEAAILEADRLTERAVAGRGLADKPEAYRSTAINGFLQYTLEVMAQAKVVGKDLTPRQKAKWIVAASAANTGYALIMNSRPLPDYINAVVAGMSDEGEDDERGVPERVLDTGKRVLGETMKFNPVTSNLAQTLPKEFKETLFGSDSDLTRFDGTAAPIRVLDNAYRSGKAALQGNAQEAVSRGLRLVPTGNQVQKTGNAAIMNARGYAVDKNGKPTFAAPTSTADKARGLVFGPYATDAAKAYYKDGTGSVRLTKSQQEMVDTAVGDRREQLRKEYLAINAAKRNAKTDEEKEAAADSVSTPTLDALKKERATESKIDRYVNDNVSPANKSILEKYYSLDEKGRDKWFHTENDAEFKYWQAKYENDKKEGKIDKVDEVKWQYNLRKDYVGSKYPKDVRDAMSLSKEKVTQYVSSTDNPDEVARQMYEYDKKLYEQGLSRYRKFKNGLTYAVNTGKTDEKLSKTAQTTAQKYGVPADIFGALIRQESGGNQGAVSSAGATGLTQLMPATAKGLGVDPNDPVQNLDGGARYLAEQYKRFGSWELALAAYNAGPGAVQQYGGIPPFAETQNYVRSIMGSLGDGAQFLASLSGKGGGLIYKTIGGDGSVTQSTTLAGATSSSRSSGGSRRSSSGGRKAKKFTYALNEFAPKNSESAQKKLYDLLKKAKMKQSVS